MPNYSQGLTHAGLARINQSIEAFCYCVLRSQAKTCVSILGGSGGATETQREFLDRIEDSITLTKISDSIQRYQEAIAYTKTRLDFVVPQGVWLMPSRMVINTESIVGYNNMLMTAKPGMKLGVNNDVNRETQKASLRLMDGGPTKINPPDSHPSNPIHKQAIQAQGIGKKKKGPQTQTKSTGAPATQTPATQASATDYVDPHHVNKALVAVGALVLIGFVVWART